MSGVQPSWVGRPTGRCQRSKRTRIAGTTRFASGANPPIQRTMSTMPADSLEDTSGQPRGYQRTTSRVRATNTQPGGGQRRGCQRTTSSTVADNFEDVSAAITDPSVVDRSCSERIFNRPRDPDRVAIATLRRTSSRRTSMPHDSTSRTARLHSLVGRSKAERGGCKYGRAHSSRLDCRSSR
jgi:hypothetical protein